MAEAEGRTRDTEENNSAEVRRNEPLSCYCSSFFLATKGTPLPCRFSFGHKGTPLPCRFCQPVVPIIGHEVDDHPQQNVLLSWLVIITNKGEVDTIRESSSSMHALSTVYSARSSPTNQPTNHHNTTRYICKA